MYKENSSSEVYYSSVLYLVLQLLIQATRMFEVTMQTATATVSLSVNRNPSQPTFTSGQCSRPSFAETSAQGTSVFQLLASDNDPIVSKNNTVI